MEPRHLQTIDRVLLGLLASTILFAPVAIAATQISLGLAVIVWVAKMVLARRWEVVRTPIDPALGSFAGIALLGSAVSIHPLQSFIHLKHLLLISIVYLLVAPVRNHRTLHRLGYLLIASTSLAAVWGLARYFLGINDRVLATQSTTMTYAAMTAMTATLTAAYLFFGKLGWRSLLFAIGLAAQIGALAFSYVRGAYLGLAAGLFLLAALKERRLVIYLTAGFILLALFLPRDILDRAVSITDLQAPTTQVRLIQWRTALPILRDHPFLGVGWIDLSELARQYVSFEEGVPPRVRKDVLGIGHFHSTYVTILVYFGLIGFLAFAWLLLRIGVKGYRTHRALLRGDTQTAALGTGSLAAFGSFLVSGVFDWTFGDAEVVTVLWIVLGLMFAALRVEKAPRKPIAASVSEAAPAGSQR